jgi:hypothetical protein
MSYNVKFTDGTLNVVVPPCVTTANGNIAFYKGGSITLPNNATGVLAINIFSGAVEFIVDTLMAESGVRYPDYAWLEFIVTRNGWVESHEPLVPFETPAVLSTHIWTMVSNPLQNPITIGGPNGLNNYYNGHIFNVAGASLLDITLSKEAAPGFQLRFINTTATGFRLLTDSSVPIAAKAALSVTGIASAANLIVLEEAVNGDAKWTAIIT